MKLTQLTLQNFRNLEQFAIQPGAQVNVIYGDNAQGKTNILEAIWLFTGNHSFRGAKASEMTRFEQPFCELSLEFEDAERTNRMKLQLGSRKECSVNGVPMKTPREFAGKFYAVIFSPGDLELVKGNPQKRRQFLNDAITELSPKYQDYLEQYEKVLDQRNALLRETVKFPALKDTLFIWDEQLAKLGTILQIYRADYVKKLAAVVQRLHRGMTGEDTLTVCYASTVFAQGETVDRYEDHFVKDYLCKLQEALDNDLRFGHTTVGIHRDDLELQCNGLSMKSFGSQGQQRSTALLLKLGEAALLQKITGEAPVILLDDVMSELDAKRQNYILNQVKDQQVFITCCDIYNTVRLEQGKIFYIREGQLVEETELIPENGAE